MGTALALAKLAKLELYHGHFLKAVEAGEAALRLLTIAYEDGADIVVELRQIVAQSRAEAGSGLQRCGPNRLMEVSDFPVHVNSQTTTLQHHVEGPELPPAFVGRTVEMPVAGIHNQKGVVSSIKLSEPICILGELD